MSLLIDGTVYEPIHPDSYTVEFDVYMQQIIAAAGITEHLAVLSEENSAPAGRALMEQLAVSGELPRLLSGFVQETGVPWTAKAARDTAARFAKVTSPHERTLLVGLLVSGLQSFFQSGPRS